MNQTKKKKLRKKIRNYDLIYTFWPHLNPFPDFDKPIICTYHDATLLEFPEILGGLGTKIEFENTKDWITKSAKVVVSSSQTKKILSNFFGEKCMHFPVVHHAIVPSKLEKNTFQENKKVKNLPKEYFVYPSNTVSHKNHYNLFVAWSRFEKRKDYPLILFGSGTKSILSNTDFNYPEDSQLLRLIGLVKRLGLKINEDFLILGYVDDSDVLSIIQNAKALIMPSLSEGGGSFPIEEALTLGTPVLCSNIPVMREHLSFRSAKIVWFDPYSPESILTSIEKIIHDYDYYKQSAMNGSNDLRPGWNDIASDYINIFQEFV